jgi:hypothetical protein
MEPSESHRVVGQGLGLSADEHFLASYILSGRTRANVFA